MRHQRLVLFFLTGTIVMALLMRWQGSVLQQSAETKTGIVALELAGNKLRAMQIIEVWKTAAVLPAAIRNTQLDFIFIFFYSLFFYSACFQLSLSQNSRMQRISQYLSLAALVAGCCDVVENGLLLQQFNTPVADGIYEWTTYFATAKFVLLIVIISWIFLSILQRFFLKRRF